DQAGAQDLNVLVDAAPLRHDRGGIAGDVVVLLLRPPAERARLLVQGHDGSVRPTRAANQRLAVDKGGFGVGPQIAIALEVFLQVFLPHDFAGGGRGADQVTVGTDRVQEVAVDRRGRAWTGIIGAAV